MAGTNAFSSGFSSGFEFEAAYRPETTPIYVDAGRSVTQVDGASITVSNEAFDAGNNETNAVVTSSVAAFTARALGDYIIFNIGGVWTPFIISFFTSDSIVSVKASGGATGLTDTTFVRANWVHAPNVAHLTGESVAMVLDGVVTGSPNNPAIGGLTPTRLEGTTLSPASLGINPGAYFTTMTLGLPYTSDIQTLDIDTAQGSVKPGKFLITHVGAWVDNTLAFYAGPEEPTTANGLTVPGGGSMQQFQVLDRNENVVTTPTTGYRTLNFEGRWGESGSVFIRHVDPSPLTVLALVPSGTFPR